MGKRIRWGVIGTANIAKAAVIPAIQAATDNEVVAIASRSRDRAREYAGERDIARYYGDYRELIDDSEIDAVYVPLPNRLHREWSVEAVRAGKHVLCEKPLAMDAAECLEMKHAADENNVLLMEAFMYRFHPRTEMVKRMVDEGALGRLSTIEASFTFRLTKPENIRFSAELGGGALMDVGCYCVNVIRTMTDEEPTLVSALSVPTESGVDGRLTGLMEFPSGLHAHFDCSLLDERRERYIVAGETGYLEVDGAFLPGDQDVVVKESRGRKGETLHTIKGVDEYRLMVEHFADCIAQGKKPRYNVEEAAANMRAIEALKKSARRKGEVIEPDTAKGKLS